MSEADPLTPAIAFESVYEYEVDALFALRMLAMQDSMAGMGPLNPIRVRQCFEATFDVFSTRHIVFEGQRIGFVALQPVGPFLLLSHLHLHPDYHNRGVGGTVLTCLQREAAVQHRVIQVAALRRSPANRFYLRHGFVKTGEDEWDIYYEWAAWADCCAQR
jgi:ribosomal protein S18 acetylase RimI-like enzyme